MKQTIGVRRSVLTPHLMESISCWCMTLFAKQVNPANYRVGDRYLCFPPLFITEPLYHYRYVNIINDYRFNLFISRNCNSHAWNSSNHCFYCTCGRIYINAVSIQHMGIAWNYFLFYVVVCSYGWNRQTKKIAGSLKSKASLWHSEETGAIPLPVTKFTFKELFLINNQYEVW